MNKCDSKSYKQCCGKSTIKVLDNLAQQDLRIAGRLIPVKMLVYPCQEASLKNVGCCAEESAKRFKKMFA